MNKYRLFLSGFGLDDIILESLDDNIIEIKKRGEIWNKVTGKRYEENIIRFKCDVDYNLGYESAISILVGKIKNDQCLLKALLACNYLELQIFIDGECETPIPSIHINHEHLSFLTALNAHIDISIN